MAVELAAVVSLDILDLAVKEEVQPVQEVAGARGAVGRVHPGESDLGMPVDGGEGVPLGAVPVAHDGTSSKVTRSIGRED